MLFKVFWQVGAKSTAMANHLRVLAYLGILRISEVSLEGSLASLRHLIH